MRTRTALLPVLGVLAVGLVLSLDPWSIPSPDPTRPSRGGETTAAATSVAFSASTNDASTRRAAAAPSRAEDDVGRPPSEAPTTAPSESVRVSLRDERALPCSPSSVVVRADADARWCVGTEPGELVLRGHGLSAAVIAVPGHATVALDLRNRAADVISVALSACRSLRCEVRDAEGRFLANWPVLVACEDDGALQRHWNVRTNGTGRVELGELGAARYVIHVLEWRDCFAATQRVDLASSIGDVVMIVARRRLESFVPVDVVDAPATGAADGVLRGVALDVQGEGLDGRVAIHEDGKAFVVGTPGAALRVRVVRTFRDSDRIEVLDPEWHTVVVGATSARVPAARRS